MLTRIRAHNFRCLVDFEYRPRPIEVLAGHHGSGRSSLIEVLDNVNNLLGGQVALDAFPHFTSTAWTQRANQVIEVELATEAEPYVYTVEAAHGSGEFDTWLAREELRQGNQVLLTNARGEARLREPDGSFTQIGDLKDDESALCHDEAQNSEAVRAFLDQLRHLWVMRPSPDEMLESIPPGLEFPYPGCDLCMFAPWYIRATRTDPQAVAALHRELAAVIDGFVEFSLVEYEDMSSAYMQAVLSAPSRGTLRIGLEELSHSERALIQLYALIHLGLRPGRILCIDTPGAYIGSAMLRRWLGRLLERAGEVGAQVLVVIDDPAALEQVPASAITRFERDGVGAIARIRASH